MKKMQLFSVSENLAGHIESLTEDKFYKGELEKIQKATSVILDHTRQVSNSIENLGELAFVIDVLVDYKYLLDEIHEEGIQT